MTLRILILVGLEGNLMYELVVTEGPTKGQRIGIPEKVAFLGRSKKNDLQIKDLTISRKHLKLTSTDQGLLVEDLNSHNGTRVNGRSIDPGTSVSLREGSEIRLGNTTLCLERMLSRGQPEDPLSDEEIYSGEERRSPDRRDAELIREVSWCLANGSQPVRQSVDKVLALICSALPRIDRAGVLALDARNNLRGVALFSRLHEDIGSFRFSRVLVNRTVQNEKPQMVLDADRELGPETDELRENHIRSALCVPLFKRSEVFAVLYLDAVRRPRALRRSDVSLLENIGALLSSHFIKNLFSADLPLP